MRMIMPAPRAGSETDRPDVGLCPARRGAPAYDFSGRLSFDWPAGDCLRGGAAQFRRGYGLSYRRPARTARLPVGPAIAKCPPDTD